MNAVEIYEKAIAQLEQNKIDCGEFNKMIEPLKDVAPVRHGRWESFEDVFMETCYQCSECGLSFYLADGGTPKENEYRYCPNCGAKMDKGGTDGINYR